MCSICVCTPICMCMHVGVHMHTCILEHLHVYMAVYVTHSMGVYSCVGVCMCISVCMSLSLHVHTCILPAYVHVHTCTYMCVPAHTYLCMCVHVCALDGCVPMYMRVCGWGASKPDEIKGSSWYLEYGSGVLFLHWEMGRLLLDLRIRAQRAH